MDRTHIPLLSGPALVGLAMTASVLALSGAKVSEAQTIASRTTHQLSVDHQSQISIPPDMAELRPLYAGLPNTWPAPLIEPGGTFIEFGPLPPVQHPSDNQSTPERVALGQKLFDSPILSASGQVACASCHARELGFGDGLKTSFGHNRQRGQRNAQPLFTVGWHTSFFWDGRAPSLEHQAMMPIVNPIEMAGTRARIERRLNSNTALRAEFAAAYGVRRIRLEHTAKALAVFQRSLRPRNSKWDRVVSREGGKILNDQETLGLHLFRTKAGCASCHSGPLLSDQKFHNLGLTFFGRSLEDRGRWLVTGQTEDVGRFRTPALRSVRHTSPYMHNGLLPHLEGVVNFYNGAGGQPTAAGMQANDPLFPTTTPILRPLNLTQEEKAALVAFLETL